MVSKESRTPQQRSIPSQKEPTVSSFRAFRKDPKRMIIVALFILLLGIVPLASALTYTVQEGDNLTKLARQFNTTVDAIVEENGIENANLIRIGEELTITENTIDSSATTNSDASSSSSYAPVSGAALKAVLDVKYGVPSYSPTSLVNPDVGIGQACMRFNFDQGNDADTGSRDGVFILFEKTNGALASWYGSAGATDSGWINGFDITHDSVHVQVLFYPLHDSDSPIMMEIVNPAPNSTYGWLSRGQCHAVEIQYAD